MSQSSSPHRIRSQLHQRSCHRPRIAERHEYAPTAGECLSRAACRCRNARQADRHCLEECHRLALPERWEREDVKSGQDLLHVGPRSEEGGPYAQTSGLRFEALPFGTISNHDEVAVFHATHRQDQVVHRLARHQASDRSDDEGVFRKLEAVPSSASVAGTEADEVDSVWNVDPMAASHGPPPAEVAQIGGGDGDDLISRPTDRELRGESCGAVKDGSPLPIGEAVSGVDPWPVTPAHEVEEGSSRSVAMHQVWRQLLFQLAQVSCHPWITAPAHHLEPMDHEACVLEPVGERPRGARDRQARYVEGAQLRQDRGEVIRSATVLAGRRDMNDMQAWH
jgi:hypothetical protein